MPWNDNRNPGPWSSSSGDGQKPPDPADKAAGGGGGARPETPHDASRADDGDPWREEPPRLNRERPEKSGSGEGRPRQPPPRGPHLDELARLLRARLEQALTESKKRNAGPRLLGAVAAAALGVWTLSGFYRVEPGQQAAVMRLGAFTGLAGPGLGYHLPYPLGWARKVSLSAVNRLDIGGAGADESPSGGQMLTRDGDLAEVAYSVQWRVADAAKYLFGLHDPDTAVKRAAESAMRAAVGQASLAEALDSGRGRLEQTAERLMQAELDRVGAGVSVVEVQVRDVQPPQAVAAAYRDAAAARQDADAGVSDAEAYRTRVVGEARAESARLTQAAQGYRDQEVAEANGEAARFAQVDEQYRRAPGVTRQRIYIETMEHVLRASNKVVVDAKGASTVTLPPELFRAHATPDAQRPASAASGQTPAQPQAQPQAQPPTQPQAQSRPAGGAQ
jgi:membrane protease subunit HflK